jgi:hypothetical protein
MVEAQASRHGETVLTFQGRYMASSIDPVREAQSWLKYRQNQVRHVDTAFVLGVGAGYHLVALQKFRPDLKIVAIDTRRECIDFVKREHALDLADVKFIHLRVSGISNRKRLCVKLCKAFTRRCHSLQRKFLSRLFIVKLKTFFVHDREKVSVRYGSAPRYANGSANSPRFTFWRKITVDQKSEFERREKRKYRSGADNTFTQRVGV